MKHSITHRNSQGSALVASLAAIATVAAAVGVTLMMTTHTARIADRSQEMAIVQAATEGALEHGYAIWKSRLAQQNRAITTSEANNQLGAPSYTNLSYTQAGALTISATNAHGTPSDNPTALFVDVPGYPGWRGRSFLYLARARMSSAAVPGTPIEYGVKRFFSYTEVPLFQSMFFFEDDFELYRPNKMNITGLTHTNGQGFVSNDMVNDLPVVFQDYVSHVLGWTNETIPYRANTWSGHVPGTNQPVTFSEGMESQLNQVNRLEPLGQDPAMVLDEPPSSPLSPSGQLIGPDGDSDGNPNNDSMHELIEPPVSGHDDPPELAKRRLYNKAGIVVTINGNSKTITTQNGTTLTTTQRSTITNAISATSIYDKREQGYVRVSNVNMSSIRSPLNGAAGFNGVIYIQDVTPLADNIKKNAVRLQDGGRLPDRGLTVASPNGVYIQGDYNTGTTTNPSNVPANNNGNPNNTDSPEVSGYSRKPAAVVADAVMILSNAWDDSNSSKSIGNRKASNTTINTAILAGFIPSGYHPAVGSQYGYSGGANNYPRFLEDWGSRYMTYFGSMVELFQSTSFTGRWDTGDIYSPPIRCWNYDTNFDDNPPPGSIDAVAITRGTWARY